MIFAVRRKVSGSLKDTGRIPRRLIILVSLPVFAAGMSLFLHVSMPASADVLRGEVNKEEELMRISRPGSGAPNSDDLRLERLPPVAPPIMKGGLVDVGSFSNPLKGRAQSDDANLGAAASGKFGSIPESQFELGADRGSKELVLAWERWHHQLSQAIYTRWSEMCDCPGAATLKITVTRDRSIQAVMVRSSGRPEFDKSLLAAIFSLNGNPGLTFPSKSQRQQVSLESDYIAGTNVNPGFSWVRNDYEKVHESY
jgi:hypothetical protein